MPTAVPSLRHTLNAVEGWLGLGLPREARSELDALPHDFQERSDCLDARFAIEAHCRDWQAAFEVALRHVERFPGHAGAWIHRAYAARRRVGGGGIPEALALLRPAVERFPAEPLIPYNLSCYHAQQADLDQAWRWLMAAMAVAGREPIRRLALADDDLRPLWTRIAALT